MKIEEVSELTGLEVRTIRFYNEQNIVKPSFRGKAKKQAEYDDADIAKLQAVHVLRNAGVSNKQLQEYAEKDALLSSDTFDEIIKSFEEKKKEIDCNIGFLELHKFMITCFENDDFLFPFYSGLSFEDLYQGRKMVECIEETESRAKNFSHKMISTQMIRISNLLLNWGLRLP